MIFGSKVSLRPITSDDTELIVKWRNNPKVRCNFVYRNDFTVEGHTKWLTEVIGSGKAVQFLIIVNETSMPIGSVYLRDIDHDNDKAEFGIFIGEDSARGMGYGSEATRLICKYGFEQLYLHKIILRVFEYNSAAIRAYERAGFKREALFVDDLKFDGEYVNMIFMALFKDDILN